MIAATAMEAAAIAAATVEATAAPAVGTAATASVTASVLGKSGQWQADDYERSDTG